MALERTLDACAKPSWAGNNCFLKPSDCLPPPPPALLLIGSDLEVKFSARPELWAGC